mmetsp:Transcript_57067/g.63802  ORF Transcript_57067/g.63802 Transcript_57067/m.63802 type:complete len:124 (-) Transcript_57067:31-402(-)
MVNAASKKDPINGMSLVSRVLIFVALPLFAGMMGLYSAYLKRDGREIKIEADFGLPFILALLLAITIGFQTNGFTSSQAKPVISWPKVKKKQKVIHEHVVKGQDLNSLDDNVDKKESVAKKNE